MEPSKENESENLAQRLRSLYKTYECEPELPEPDDLVAKLSGVKSEVRDAIEMELNCDNVYPISYEEAEKVIYEATEDEETFQNLIEGFLEQIPDAEKEDIMEYLLGKTTEVPPKEMTVKKFVELYDNDARLVFKGFKANLKYFLKI